MHANRNIDVLVVRLLPFVIFIIIAIITATMSIRHFIITKKHKKYGRKPQRRKIRLEETVGEEAICMESMQKDTERPERRSLFRRRNRRPHRIYRTSYEGIFQGRRLCFCRPSDGNSPPWKE